MKFTEWLEHRIPPPVVGLLLGAAMWAAARHLAALDVPMFWRQVLAGVFIALGLTCELMGFFAFRRAKTTVNPLKPEATSSLVIVGVYRRTRNPMYVGFATQLLGWALYLAVPVLLIGPALFVAYITRFQIKPEERVLREKFGASFDDFVSQVPRWM